MDCMDGMKEFPDKYFDLAIVDPPYGSMIGEDYGGPGGTRFGGRFDAYKRKIERTGRSWSKKYGTEIIDWDKPPSDEYFSELFRVSKNQIIWGGNYFSLPPTRCFIIWKKTNIPQNFSMAMCEYAWASFFDNAKVYEQDATRQQDRFHPTQKPVELYRWLLSRYAKDGDKILDTHVGSASSLIACYQLGFQYVGFEIDSDYYEKANARLNKAKAQASIFDFMQPETETIALL